MTGAGVGLGVLLVILGWFVVCHAVGFILTALVHGTPAVLTLRAQANTRIHQHRTGTAPMRRPIPTANLDALAEARARNAEVHRQYEARYGYR